MSYHRFRKYPNIIKELAINRPNQVWVSDITYIGKREKPCYLSLITDAYSNKIVGFEVSNTMCTSRVVSIMKKIVVKAISIYNNDRPHWSNHMLTPNQMHRQKNMNYKTYKTKNSRNLYVTTV